VINRENILSLKQALLYQSLLNPTNLMYAVSFITTGESMLLIFKVNAISSPPLAQKSGKIPSCQSWSEKIITSWEKF